MNIPLNIDFLQILLHMLNFVILFIVIEDSTPYPSLHGGEYNLLERV